LLDGRPHFFEWESAGVSFKAFQDFLDGHVSTLINWQRKATSHGGIM